MGRKEGIVTLLISCALIVTEKNLLLVITLQLPPVQSQFLGLCLLDSQVPSATFILFLTEQLEQLSRARQPKLCELSQGSLSLLLTTLRAGAHRTHQLLFADP